MKIKEFMQGYIFLFLLFVSGTLQGQQQTMGLFQNSPASYDGYTLFAPSSYRNTYLINNCGEKVHEWFSDTRPTSSYLLPNGNLLRVGVLPSSFSAGGSAGLLEILDWESTVLWSYEYAGLDYHQHHDVEPLPNGNILLVAWEWHSMADAIAHGRDPQKITNEGLWSEHIAELRPLGSDSAEIVWMWRVWDHLIQDYDATLPNYGNIAEHPERFDINYISNASNSGLTDWMHVNSIDYNPELDQVMLSSRVWSEIWVIDHSTTTAEAATSTGGNTNKGGDILYRYGNPVCYQRGSSDDQRFFGQHDAHWIEAGKPDEGKIMVFNNGLGRPNGSFSTFDVIEPPLQSDGTYSLLADSAYSPSTLYWSYDGDGSYFSPTVSGVQQQPNGTFLGCIGRSGRFIEVDTLGNTVWEYICPIQASGPAQQGVPLGGNSVFKINRYAASYTGFDGKILEAQGPIELFPLMNPCALFTPTLSPFESSTVQLAPNPSADFLAIKSSASTSRPLKIFDSYGRCVHSSSFTGDKRIAVSSWSAGLYFVHVDGKVHRFLVQ